MRAATSERMIRIMISVLIISIGFLVPKAAAQSDKYSKVAPIDVWCCSLTFAGVHWAFIVVPQL